MWKSKQTRPILDHIHFVYIFLLYLFRVTFYQIKVMVNYLQQPDLDWGTSSVIGWSLIV